MIHLKINGTTRPYESSRLIAMANFANSLWRQGTTAATRGALTPFASCKSAIARRTTRTCCTPPLNTFCNSSWSFVATSIFRAKRAIPKYAHLLAC